MRTKTSSDLRGSRPYLSWDFTCWSALTSVGSTLTSEPSCARLMVGNVLRVERFQRHGLERLHDARRNNRVGVRLRQRWYRRRGCASIGGGQVLWAAVGVKGKAASTIGP
ncbi:MAG TPA: hypothetical protein VMG82_33795 [Candidatus Sulfotelmatobacter sp.]|nr:hypothetical protein [Candidatus Sulfotelmatobacter sp.]